MKLVAADKPLPISFVVGAHPIDHVAAVMRLPVDELPPIAQLRAARPCRWSNA